MAVHNHSYIYIPNLLLGKCAVILLCIITDSNEETETCNNELSNTDLLPQLKLGQPCRVLFLDSLANMKQVVRVWS